MIDLLWWMVLAVAALYGAVIGSFLNVISLRYAAQLSDRQSLLSVVGGRSRCPHCEQTLRWWELVPIVSFVFLRGKCQRCQQKISYQYPLIELLMAVITVGIVARAGVTLASIGLAVISALLLVLASIDFKTFLLPDVFIIVLTGAVAVTLGLQGRLFEYMVLGGIGVGAGFLLLLWVITRGRGIGLGDVKLLVPLGMLFGTYDTILLLFMAFGGGGLVGIFLLLRGGATLKTAVPFGPFLIAATVLLLLWPELSATFFSLFAL